MQYQITLLTKLRWMDIMHIFIDININSLKFFFKINN